MPRLSKEQWADVRAEREAGATFRELAEKFGVSDAAIVKRAKAEGWGDGSDVREQIRRKVSEKVSGLVSGADPKRRAEALDRAAQRAAEVIERHKADWEQHRQRFGAVTTDFESGKHAKINAEMLTIRQRGERLAWGLEDTNPAPKIEIKREW
ncbi:hypothetical protein [Oceanicella actignis]|uniref:hypothetical protein n=1 Tax=Oceanicella actignis TaxID=1189325 RepID=UPI0011E7C7E4|nr:hypothetical protein [Oceanicella actignis]TYO91442.1 hypothetical protein LY05_00295 [Oceanicella actignis]